MSEEVEEITIPVSMYNEFMKNTSILEKIYEVIELKLIDNGEEWFMNADNELSVQMGCARKLQEWSIQYSALHSDYQKLKKRLEGND